MPYLAQPDPELIGPESCDAPGMSGGIEPGATPGEVSASTVRWPVLATRNAKLLLVTRLLGQGSDGLLQASLGSFVLFSPERQATAARVAATFAVLLIPYSLIGPFAGVFLDRWSRVRVLVVANVVRAATVLGIAAMVAAGRDGLDLGAAVLLAMGAARLVLAGLSAGLPHAVAADRLVTANALFPTAGSIASAAATVLGLLVMGARGDAAASTLLLLVALLLLAAAAVAGLIPRLDLGPEPQEAGARHLTDDLAAVVAGMVAGVRYVHHRPTARRAIGIVVAHRIVFGALLIDVLLIVRNTLNPPEQVEQALGDFALAAAGASVGALLAAVVTPRAAARLGVTRWAGVTVLAAAAVIPVFLVGRSLPVLFAGSLALGFSGQAVKIAGDTVLQQVVTDDFRGRVFSLYDVALNVALVLGTLLTAVLAPASGLSPGLWIGATALLLATAGWSLRPVRGSG